MQALSDLVCQIHIPTFVTVFIALLVTQFTLSMNGSPIDFSKPEGATNVVVAILLLLVRAIQYTPAN
jgi:hypothetical protein